MSSPFTSQPHEISREGQQPVLINSRINSTSATVSSQTSDSASTVQQNIINNNHSISNNSQIASASSNTIMSQPVSLSTPRRLPLSSSNHNSTASSTSAPLLQNVSGASNNQISSVSTMPSTVSSNRNRAQHIHSVAQAFMQLRNYFAENYQTRSADTQRPRVGPLELGLIHDSSNRMRFYQDETDSDQDESDCDAEEMLVAATAPSRASSHLNHNRIGPASGVNGIRFNPPNSRFIQPMQHQHLHALHHHHQQQVTSIDQQPIGTAHSHFRYKIVCRLECRFCQNTVCHRGMKAILLADTKVELYSTDMPPSGVSLVNESYMTENCRCRINDVACLGCGNVVGYHVTQPCETCLDSCNNGHFWMFQMEGVVSSERMDSTGLKPLLWAFLPPPERDYVALHSDRMVTVCR